MKANYTPLRFLSALGNGGMAVTFFLYLNFLVPHKGTPIVDFYSWMKFLKEGSTWGKVIIPFALFGVIFFVIRHLYFLIENLRVYKKQAYSVEQKNSLGRERMVIPLTLAMTINACFVSGSLFVPGLWTVVEYLFPFALGAFLAVGIYALMIFAKCFSSKIEQGEGAAKFNNLARLIPVFTFAMVAVGLAAPAAMSHLKVTASTGAFFSLFFFATSIFLGGIQLSAGFATITREGLDKETSATIWILLPILTIMGIAIIRLFHFFEHHLSFHATAAHYFTVISIIFSIQILVGLIGWMVMKSNGYFQKYIHGDGHSFGSYALICPGVAFFVYGMFFVHVGLIKTGIMNKFSWVHIIFVVLLALIQFKTIWTIFKLDKRLMN